MPHLLLLPMLLFYDDVFTRRSLLVIVSLVGQFWIQSCKMGPIMGHLQLCVLTGQRFTPPPPPHRRQLEMLGTTWPMAQGEYSTSKT